MAIPVPAPAPVPAPPRLEGGQRARLKVQTPTGEVVGHRFDTETGARELLFRWEVDGEVHERWFPEGELEALG